MTEWRKIHQKLTTSPSFARLSNDFTRLLWVMLPLALDKEGRGIDRPAWIIGTLFPLRADLTYTTIENAMSELAQAGMIKRYGVDGVPYFYAPNFSKYQRTDRQGASQIPAPPEPSPTNSGLTPDLLRTKSPLDIDIDIDIEIEEDETTTPTSGGKPPLTVQAPWIAEHVYKEVTGYASMPAKDREKVIGIIYDMQNAHGKKVIEYLKPFFTEWRHRNYRGTNYGWLDWAIAGEIPEPKEKEPAAPKGFSHG